MSLKDILTDDLGSEVEDITSIILFSQPPNFGKLCDKLAKLIVSWKEGSVPVTEDQCREALAIIKMVKEKIDDFQSKTSAMSEQIILIQSQLAREVLLREEKEADMQSQIDNLKSRNDNLARERDER